MKRSLFTVLQAKCFLQFFLRFYIFTFIYDIRLLQILETLGNQAWNLYYFPEYYYHV